MRIITWTGLVIMVIVPLALNAKEPSSADFDYLLGDWEFDAVSKQWGKMRGLWSAVRLAEGQILDEYRVVGDDAETLYVTTTLRNYNEHTGEWDLVGADAGGGLRDVGTARRVGDEMHIEQTFGANSDEPSLWRIRYYAIGDDQFSWVADVSRDGGKTWEAGFQTIAARRIGPARSLPPLTQVRPDFSGVWRLVPDESQMIGGGAAASSEHQMTWLVNHRDPAISVVVNVRDAQGSHEFSFGCTTDGRECVNELPQLSEVRRMSAVWDGTVLIMSQRASTPHGDFTARDRLFLTDSGQRLVFERTVINDRGERPVRQVFRKLGPYPSQRAAPAPLPSVELPPELARILREYERHWREGNAQGLVQLFTEDGFVARRGEWIRGRDALEQSLQGTSSDLRLRAVAFGTDDRVGYMIGAYSYGPDSSADRGIFILTLRKGHDGRWLITADLDGSIRHPNVVEDP